MMSDWSSFKDDKKHMDAWREFLSEEKKDKKLLNELRFLQMLGWQKLNREDQQAVAVLADKMMNDEKFMNQYFDPNTDKIRWLYKLKNLMATTWTAAGLPNSKLNVLRLLSVIQQKLEKDPESYIQRYQADESLFAKALEKVERDLKGATQKELNDPSSELQQAAAGVDPKTGKNIKIPIKNPLTTLAKAKIITPQQASKIFTAVDAFLKKAGFQNVLSEEFINEQTPFGGVTATPMGRGRTGTRTRDTAAAAQARVVTPELGSVIDLSAMGIAPANQTQVAHVLDQVLKPYKLTVNTGTSAAAAPAQTKPDTAPAQAKPDTAPDGAKPEAAKTASSDVSLSQLVRQDFTKGKPPRGVVKLGQQLKSFMDNREVSDVLAKNLVGKKVVTQLPPELQSLISIDQLRDFVVKNFPAASGDEVDALLQSVRGRKIVAEQLVRRLIVKETQRVLNEKR